MVVAISNVLEMDQARLWARVEAPTPPFAPATAIIRPIGWAVSCG